MNFLNVIRVGVLMSSQGLLLLVEVGIKSLVVVQCVFLSALEYRCRSKGLLIKVAVF